MNSSTDSSDDEVDVLFLPRSPTISNAASQSRYYTTHELRLLCSTNVAFLIFPRSEDNRIQSGCRNSTFPCSQNDNLLPTPQSYHCALYNRLKTIRNCGSMVFTVIKVRRTWAGHLYALPGIVLPLYLNCTYLYRLKRLTTPTNPRPSFLPCVNDDQLPHQLQTSLSDHYYHILNGFPLRCCHLCRQASVSPVMRPPISLLSTERLLYAACLAPNTSSDALFGLGSPSVG